MCALSSLLLCVALSTAQDTVFIAHPAVVPQGDSIQLIWDVPGADTVFISDVGVLAGKGSRWVTPRSSAVYTLVASASSRPLMLSVRVEVTGAMGGEQFPPPDEFRYPISGSLAGVRSLPRFLMDIHSFLQDSLGFSVGQTPSPEGDYLFVTMPSERALRRLKQRRIDPGDIILQRDVRQIVARRVAYLVRIRPGGGGQPVRYTVSTLAEYLRAAEETWRKEGRQDYHASVADLLKLRFERE